MKAVYLNVMDCPWKADAGGGRRGANTHYNLMTPRQIVDVVHGSGLWPHYGPMLSWQWASQRALVTREFDRVIGMLKLEVVTHFVWAKVDDGKAAVVDAMRAAGIADSTIDAVMFKLLGIDLWRPPARMGLGKWQRSEHEHLFLCRRGAVSIPEDGGKLKRSVIYAPRGAHSEKPQAAWDVIEATSAAVVVEGAPAPVEFFCRNPRPGWRAFGNQIRG